MLGRLLLLVVSPTCLGCGRESGGGRRLCPACLEDLDRIVPPCCPVCGRPYPPETEGGVLCGGCRRTAGTPVTRSVVRFAGRARDLIHRWKYGPDRIAGRPLGEILLAGYREWYPRWRPELIVPVPPTVAALRRRGFCPALDLALFLSRRIGVPCLRDGLVNRGTSQVGKSGRERRRGVRGTMAARSGTIPQGTRRILIVDDVVTTGATLREASRALRREVDRPEIRAITLARTL